MLRGLLLVTLALAAVARADDAAPTTTTLTPSPAVQSTEVHGTPPPLAGHWLVVSTISPPNNTDVKINVAAFWDVTTADGRTTLTTRYVALPPALKAALDAANGAKTAWTPTTKDLQRLRRDWDALPPEDRGLATVVTSIYARPEYPQPLVDEPGMAETQWAVQQVGDFRRGEGRPAKEILVYGAAEKTELGWKGNHLSASIVTAPFVIPLTFRGTFAMYDLGAVPEPGFVERIADVFSGCGRKP
jgi:hypothetical protein